MFWVELTLLYKVYDKLETAKHFIFERENSNLNHVHPKLMV